MLRLCSSTLRSGLSAASCSSSIAVRQHSGHDNDGEKPKKKSREEIMKEKTPSGKLDEKNKEKPYEDPHLRRHPDGVNPKTGEVGGPAGPEPTRYGDWERKGRVTDF